MLISETRVNFTQSKDDICGGNREGRNRGNNLDFADGFWHTVLKKDTNLILWDTMNGVRSQWIRVNSEN